MRAPTRKLLEVRYDAPMTQAPKLLIAADAALTAILREEFARCAGLALSCAHSTEAALRAIDQEPPQILLLDDNSLAAEIFLPQARAAGFAGAAIILASAPRPTLADLGVCIPRPFRFAELLARVRALSAQAEPVIGPYRLRADFAELTDETGRRIRLTEKETAILSALARAEGGVLAREVLLRDVWGYNRAVTTHTLETHVHRLRRKLEREPSRPRLLLTEKGGYRLNRL